MMKNSLLIFFLFFMPLFIYSSSSESGACLGSWCFRHELRGMGYTDGQIDRIMPGFHAQQREATKFFDHMLECEAGAFLGACILSQTVPLCTPCCCQILPPLLMIPPATEIARQLVALPTQQDISSAAAVLGRPAAPLGLSKTR